MHNIGTTEQNIAFQNMLRQQIREGFVTDEKILKAYKHIPREFFVPEAFRQCAYADLQIPIGNQQVMLRPQEEALILQALNIKKYEQVLEIGTGTGFFTALLASQAKHVDSIDIYAEFIKAARQRLHDLHIENINLLQQDATRELPNKHYDVIVFTASTPLFPKFALKKLQNFGRLFAIVGKKPIMEALISNRQQTIINPIFELVVPELIHAPQPEKFIF